MVLPPANGPSVIVTASSVAWLRLSADLNPMNSGAFTGTGWPAGMPPVCWRSAGRPLPTNPVRVSRRRSADEMSSGSAASV